MASRRQRTWPSALADDRAAQPEGWTGPKEVDGQKVEDFWRSHQVPVSNGRGDAAHRKILEEWMRGYRPDELFDENGRLRPELTALAPEGEKRMGALSHANGGVLKRDLLLPDWKELALDVPQMGAMTAEATRVMGQYLREVVRLIAQARNFRPMGPDETASNRLDAVFEVTERVWMDRIIVGDPLMPKVPAFAKAFAGRWRIVEMDVWDNDPSTSLKRRSACAEFSWEGHDENDPASGRRWLSSAPQAGSSATSTSTMPTIQASSAFAADFFNSLLDPALNSARPEDDIFIQWSSSQ
jgi:hypothetical protein